MANVITFIVSWLLVTPFWEMFEEENWKDWPSGLMYVHRMLFTTIPLCSTLFNTLLLSDTIFHMLDFYLIVIVSVLFLTISFIYTTITGNSVYSFLTFTNW